MKQTQIIMGMPVTLEITGQSEQAPFDEVFGYFRSVDERFSPYKKDSELSELNRGLDESRWSQDMREVMRLCEDTKKSSGGYFDIKSPDGTIDTSGLVKGWAIDKAAKLLKSRGLDDFYIEAGGDIQAEGKNAEGEPWLVGIRNPFDINEIVKVIRVSGQGVATSGTYIRGQHIYNPHKGSGAEGPASLTVIAPDILEADRFATAAFAMGENGIGFIGALPGFSGYMITNNKHATYTSTFEYYVS